MTPLSLRRIPSFQSLPSNRLKPTKFPLVLVSVWITIAILLLLSCGTTIATEANPSSPSSSHQQSLETAKNLIHQYNSLVKHHASSNHYKECYALPWNEYIESVDPLHIEYLESHDKIKVSTQLYLKEAFGEDVLERLQREADAEAEDFLYRASIWHQESGEIFKEPKYKFIRKQNDDNQESSSSFILSAAFFVEPRIYGNYEMTLRSYLMTPDDGAAGDKKYREEMLCVDVPFKIDKDLKKLHFEGAVKKSRECNDSPPAAV